MASQLEALEHLDTVLIKASVEEHEEHHVNGFTEEIKTNGHAEDHSSEELAVGAERHHQHVKEPVEEVQHQHHEEPVEEVQHQHDKEPVEEVQHQHHEEPVEEVQHHEEPVEEVQHQDNKEPVEEVQHQDNKDPAEEVQHQNNDEPAEEVQHQDNEESVDHEGVKQPEAGEEQHHHDQDSHPPEQQVSLPDDDPVIPQGGSPIEVAVPAAKPEHQVPTNQPEQKHGGQNDVVLEHTGISGDLDPDLSLEQELIQIRNIRRQASNYEEVKKEIEASSRPVLSKASMTTSINTESVRAAYEDVRSDASETEWAVFKFKDQNIVCSATGAGFSAFREHFQESERAFGYIRIQMGDEMSKRQKFVFITWVGPQVSVIRRAKMSIDKAMVKDIVKNFAVELQLESLSEMDVEYFREQLSRAGGANYGTGVREG